MALITVIIPTRNRSAMLARALASVTAQTVQDYEIVVVDDASSADEAAAIKRLVDDTPKARLLRNETNAGAPICRNQAARVSSGDIIALLDSDDWWAPERLAAHRSALAHDDIVFSYNRAGQTRGGEEDVFAIYNAPPDAGRSLEVSLAAWNFVGGCSSVCVKRSAFDQVGGFNEALPSCQDWDLWIRLGQLGPILFIPEVLTFQDCGPHDRISTSRAKAEAGHQVIGAAVARMPLSNSDRRFVRAHHHRTRAWLEANCGEPRKALAALLRSMLVRPTRLALASLPEYVVRYAASLLGR